MILVLYIMITSQTELEKAYLSEAKEILELLNNSLVALEKTPQDQKLLYELMRGSHTLKSSSKAMGYNQLAELFHVMEDFFDASRKGSVVLDKKLNDLLFSCFDTLAQAIRLIEKGGKEPDTSKLQKLLKQTFSEVKKETPVVEGTELARRPELFEPIKEIKVETKKLDILMNLAEELLICKMRFEEIDNKKNYTSLKSLINQLSKLASEIQYRTTEARMVSLSHLFNRFPRMVRDLAVEENKKIDLVIEGQDLELDRTIIDELAEPLVHLLRNAVDHGIQTQGIITLTAKRTKNFSIIEIADNGAGIDFAKVKQAAINRKIITSKEITQESLRNLIYHPQLSTKEKVTEVSGRGVGLAIVKERVEALGGQVSFETKIGQGTKFILELPLTLAIIEALLVKAGKKTFAIPSNSIERSVYIMPDQIKKGLDVPVAVLNKNDIPLLDLASHFKLKDSQKMVLDKQITAVIIIREKGPLGVVVDELINEEEITVKPLPRLIKAGKGIAGSTILGDGQVALILDTATLL